MSVCANTSATLAARWHQPRGSARNGRRAIPDDKPCACASQVQCHGLPPTAKADEAHVGRRLTMFGARQMWGAAYPKNWGEPKLSPGSSSYPII